MTDSTTDLAESNRSTIQWAVGLATLVLTPSVYFYFNTFGAPFDEVFVPNFYHSPLEARLEPYAQLIGFVLASLISIGIVFGIRRWTGAAFPIWRTVISVLATLYALNFLRSGVLFWFSLREILEFFRSGSILYFALLAIALLVILFVLVRYRRQVDYVLTRVLRAYSLVAVIFIFNAISAIVVLEPFANLEVKSAAPVTAKSGDQGRQFVVMIFDQADQGFIFDDRDPTVLLPNLDRLRAKSIYSPDMKSSGTSTFFSVPAITLGFKGDVQKTTPDSPTVELPDGQTVLWSDAPTAFSDAEAAGSDVILMVQDYNVGSFCRVFAKLTTKCWQSMKWRNYPIEFWPTVIHSTNLILKRFIYSMPLVRLVASKYFLDIGGYGAFPTEHYSNTLFTMQDAVVKVFNEPLSRDRLLYVHWNVPHQPFIYDRHENKMIEPVSGSVESYKSNLELMDLVVGRMLDAIEASPNAKRTTLLVTADHGTLPPSSDERTVNIPFILLTPDQPEPIEITGKFSSTRIRALINQWLDGTVESAENVRRILATQAATAK